MRRRRVAWAALLYLLLAAPGWTEESQLEVAVKATYLVKFAAFVEWPASAFQSPAAPLTICVVGHALAGLAERAAQGQSAGKHPLAVRHIASATRGNGCNILFSAGAPEQSVTAALDALRGEPVLTVTEEPEAAGRKGIINFVLQNGHVRFQIDDREAVQDGLHISSQLLALAVNKSAR